MTEGYVPAMLTDEVSPPPRETPDAWLRQENGRFYIDARGVYYSDEEMAKGIEITFGKAIEFMRLEDFGEATLIVHADRGFSVEPPMPAGAESVCVEHDPDTLANSVEEMVASDFSALEPGEYAISYFTWHDELWTFDGAKFTRGGA